MASKVESPPYPSAAKISDSSCFPQYTASLKYPTRLPPSSASGHRRSEWAGPPPRSPASPFLIESCQRRSPE
uniref:Uncharacterized protein n=1 Tax=Chenopodium quinoa TaxID=63459 RepID=A0A803NBG8_CHEQI